MTLECDKCGTANEPGSQRCRICGHLLPPGKVLAPDRLRCPKCQSENFVWETECTVCGQALRADPTANASRAKLIRTDEWEETVGQEDIPHRAQRVAWATLGGILIILAGILGVADAVFTLDVIITIDVLNDASTFCITVWIILALLAVMGGTLALMRIGLPMVIVGGIAGIFAMGCILGSILSFVGLIFVILARKEFGLR